MARTSLTIKTYNQLYGTLKGAFSGKGMSFQLNSFSDGSSVITVMIAGGNATVGIKAIICTIFDEKDEKIIGYRVSDDDKSYTVNNLSQAVGYIRKLTNDARIILNKVN